MKKTSYQIKIPLLIFVLVVSSVFLTALFFFMLTQPKLEDNAIEKNLIISEMISHHMDQYLQDARDTLLTASSFSSSSYGDLNKIEDEIFRIYDNFNYFDLIFFMSKEAKMVFSKPDNEHVNSRSYTDRSYYWDIIHDKQSYTISPLLISSVLNQPHFILGGPVYDKDKAVIGLIGAGLPLYNLRNIIEDAQKSFKGNIWLIDDDGSIIIHPTVGKDSELIHYRALLKSDDLEKRFEAIKSNGESVITDYYVDDQHYYAAISFPKEAEWMIVVEQNENVIFNDLNQLKYQWIRLSFVLAVIALMVGLMIARSVTVPISKLVKAVRAVGMKYHGDDESDSLTVPQNEIEELNHVFSDMTTKLDASMMKLNDSITREQNLQKYLNDIFSSLKLGIVVVNHNKQITVCNHEVSLITGLKTKEMIGVGSDSLLEHLELNINEAIDKVFEHGHIYQDIHMKIKCYDGQEKPITCTISQLLDRYQKPIGVVIQFRDITRLKLLEEEARRSDRVRTIGELSAAIIHDLGNPLAGMSSLIELLKSDQYKEEVKQEVLDVLEEEVKDLNQTVINYLDFVRSSTLKTQQIDVVMLIEHVLGILKHELKENNITIQFSKFKEQILLTVDKNLIKQVLYNILLNSIQSIDERGTINIDVSDGIEFCLITIEDSGQGMSSEELGHLFSPFFSTKSTGNGLGMFISHNIIKEHGGDLIVKSIKNEGTLVELHIPKERKYS